jgi:hypothetical protein
MGKFSFGLQHEIVLTIRLPLALKCITHVAFHSHHAYAFMEPCLKEEQHFTYAEVL